MTSNYHQLGTNTEEKKTSERDVSQLNISESIKNLSLHDLIHFSFDNSSIPHTNQ